MNLNYYPSMLEFSTKSPICTCMFMNVTLEQYDMISKMDKKRVSNSITYYTVKAHYVEIVSELSHRTDFSSNEMFRSVDLTSSD